MSYLYLTLTFIFQLSSLWLIEKSKEIRPQQQPLFHFARRGLASASAAAASASATFSEDVRLLEEEEYIEVEKQKKPQPRNGKLDLAYLKAMMNLPPQDLQPLTQLQKMAHVAKNSLVHILPKYYTYFKCTYLNQSR